jgi:hypothetical protein
MAAAAILDFLHFHFRFSFFRISPYVKYILAKVGEIRLIAMNWQHNM